MSLWNKAQIVRTTNGNECFWERFADAFQQAMVESLQPLRRFSERSLARAAGALSACAVRLGFRDPAVPCTLVIQDFSISRAVRSRESTRFRSYKGRGRAKDCTRAPFDSLVARVRGEMPGLRLTVSRTYC